MDKEKLVSIIIPVYNTKDYLESCIESVLNQTYKNLEVILIDDGSTDGSEKICDLYAKEDARIKVVHQKNKGMVEAVNQGISIASGKFIAFVDSDDWIESDAYEYMMNKIEDCDLISAGLFLDYYESGDRKKRISCIPEKLYSGIEDMEYIWKNMIRYQNTDQLGILVSRCVNLYRKDIVKKIYKQRPRNVVYGEDRIFTFMYLLNCKSVKIVDDAFYHYRMNAGSCTHSADKNFLKNVSDYYVFLEEYFSEHRLKEALMCQLEYEVVELLQHAVEYRLGFKYYRKIKFEIPFDLQMFENKKVVLYGAGQVGRDYYHMLSQNQHIEKINWVDQGYEQYRKDGLLVDSIESAKEEAYDYILIGVKRELIAKDIEKELRKAGFDADKVLWKEPISVR